MIFVTGGSGFLGSYILQELVQQGKSVKALYRKRRLPFYQPPGLSDRILWVEGDLLDIGGLLENLEGCDQILHAAGRISFNPADKADMFKTNIEGTANLVNAAIEMGITDFTYISSVGALGGNSNEQPVDEEIKWQGVKGQSAYGISKYYAEMEVWRGMGEGLTPLILNPSTLLGYGNWDETSCALFKIAYREFPWYTGGINGFVDVADAARATVALMDAGIRNERFIVSAENRSYRDILQWMSSGFGKRPATKRSTPFLNRMAWRAEKMRSVFTGRAPAITRESAAIAERKTTYDNRKLLDALSTFRFRPLEDSISGACRRYAERERINP